jgi:hypothetical protein
VWKTIARTTTDSDATRIAKSQTRLPLESRPNPNARPVMSQNIVIVPLDSMECILPFLLSVRRPVLVKITVLRSWAISASRSSVSPLRTRR